MFQSLGFVTLKAKSPVGLSVLEPLEGILLTLQKPLWKGSVPDPSGESAEIAHEIFPVRKQLHGCPIARSPYPSFKQSALYFYEVSLGLSHRGT